ncbi:MAG: hypothetical protein KAH18_04450 [Psychromonas sp.]|nr:hypothetical protein [Psychromonas sp.]
MGIALNISGISQTKLALQLGVNQSSISQELKRNTGKIGYRVKQAKNKAIIKRKNSISCPVMTAATIEDITSKIKKN